MELLAEITDKDVGSKVKPPKNYRFRKAARAVLISQGKIALMNVSKKHYHKLPGGGVDPKENTLQGLAREIVEETGLIPKTNCNVGIILELRNEIKEAQVSYCYIAKPIATSKQNLTMEEKKDGFKLEWVSGIDEAIKTVEKDKPTDYEGKFIQKRDLIFLKKARQILKQD